MDPSHFGEPLDQTEGLHAPVAAQEGVDLINDDEPQIAEQPRDFPVAPDQHRLQRFRRDLQDPGGILHQLSLVGIGDVAVPVPDRDLRLFEQVVEPQKLVVNQGLERGNVEAADRRGRMLGEERHDREKGSLGLAGGGRRREQNVVVRVEDRVSCGNLNPPERLPVVPVDEVLYKWRIAGKDVHGPPPIP